MTTQRSLAAVLALFADNTSGLISPEDMRDVIETLRNGMGEIWVAAPSPTIVADNVTWLENPSTWQLNADSYHWDMVVNGRLRYTGANPRMCHIAISSAVDLVSGANENVEFCCGKNGLPIVPSIIHQGIAAGTANHKTTTFHAFCMVETGDYLSLMMRNVTSTDDIAVDYAQVFVMDMVA
jgi:hypothetical protein